MQGARAWAAALAVDVNNADLTFAATSPLSTKRAQSKLKLYEGDDIKARLMFPGPLPFTPVRVRTEGSTATIAACTWGQGWGVDATTRKPIAKRSIDGTDYVMQKTAGGWKLNQLAADNDIDCSKVTVKGRPS